MNEENSKILTEKFPKLFKGIQRERRNRQEGKPYEPIAFGFECGDGWFKLIYELSEKIEAIINTLPDVQQEDIYAAQVKEKFGGLRFYMRGYTDEINALINEAESKSYSTCEGCSKKSIILGQSWMVNFCKKCYLEYCAERNRGISPEENAKYYDECKRKIAAQIKRDRIKELNNNGQSVV